MIALDQVSKAFDDVQALNQLSFAAEDGHVTGLLGPNGAGKTTALRCIFGLTQPDDGRVLVGGRDASKQPIEVRRQLGVFTDKFGLYDRLTAREQVAYFARLNGHSVAEAEQATTAIIAELEMQDIADRRSTGFSQGQRMKVSLARALVHRPSHLVLDEPTRGLDVHASRNLRRLLLDLRSQGITILLSTHVMADVAALCDRVVVMRDGAACAAGTPAELIEQAAAADLETAFLAIIGTAEGMA